MKVLIKIIPLLLMFCAVSGFSQIDTTKTVVLADSNLTKPDKKKTYSRPRTASIMSACLPGLGQAYNKKYWKIPIIYAGLGGFGYLTYINHEQFLKYSQLLRYENDDDPSTVNNTFYGSQELKTLKEDYRRNRDFSAIAMTVVYVLNIVDANVDAHLKTFDVSDDLTLQMDAWPGIGNDSRGQATVKMGISLKLNFR